MPSAEDRFLALTLAHEADLKGQFRVEPSHWVLGQRMTGGAVEALIRGPPAAVDALVAEMRKGPRFATVNSVSVTELDETPGDEGGAFVIRATA